MELKKYTQFNEELKILNKYKCPVCGGVLYRTDAGGPDITLQCSSDEARFWDFTRGSKEQAKAYKHFNNSTIHISKEELENLIKA